MYISVNKRGGVRGKVVLHMERDVYISGLTHGEGCIYK